MSVMDGVKELRKVWGGFWSSRVLLTANNYRIFDHLASPKTALQLAKTVKANERAVEILLDAVAGLGLLKKVGSTYRNTELSNTFLVTGGTYYQGDIIRHADSLWQSWSGLDKVIKSGKPNRATPRNHEAFIRGMHNIAVLKAPAVLDSIGLKGVNAALDLGGGPGTYTMEMARRGIRVTLFDMPETVKIAKGIIRKSGLKNIAYIEGDFISDAVGSEYDLILVSQILHSFPAEANGRILAKCAAALNSGGRIAVQEFSLDKSRTSPVLGSLFAVNMLVNTPGGRCYSPAEIKAWLRNAGLRTAAPKVLEDSTLVIGKKA